MPLGHWTVTPRDYHPQRRPCRMLPWHALQIRPRSDSCVSWICPMDCQSVQFWTMHHHPEWTLYSPNRSQQPSSSLLVHIAELSRQPDSYNTEVLEDAWWSLSELEAFFTFSTIFTGWLSSINMLKRRIRSFLACWYQFPRAVPLRTEWPSQQVSPQSDVLWLRSTS